MARGAVLGAVAFTAATVLIGLLLAGCGVSLHADAGTPVGEEREDQSSAGSASPRSVAVISEQHGPSWSGELGDTVQIDWYDRHTGETTSERVAILLVKRFPDPEDDGGPDEFGDSVGPYEWKYGIKVRLTSLDERASRQPLAYQLLQLRDGHDSEDGSSAWASRVGRTRPGGAEAQSAGSTSARSRASPRRRSPCRSAPGAPRGRCARSLPRLDQCPIQGQGDPGRREE